MAAGGHHHGRPASWVVVAVIIAGFVVGGLGLMLGHWWLFWAGLGICVVGGILAVVTDVLSDVDIDSTIPGEPLRPLPQGTDAPAATSDLPAAPGGPAAETSS